MTRALTLVDFGNGGLVASGGAVVILAAPAPNRYTAAADLIEHLSREVIARRVKLGLSLTAAARQIGVGKTTMTSLEAGTPPSHATLLLTLRWLSKN